MRLVESGAGASRAVELKAVIECQRTGLPILVGRDGDGGQRVFVLEPEDERLWVGRGAACHVRIEWDEQASRSHAELERVPEGWAVVDDGLSRNGTFVGAERVAGRRRLHDGEVLRFGSSSLVYRLPGATAAPTRPVEDTVSLPDLTATQRRVLAALCRPLLDEPPSSTSATNPAIAAELVLSLEAIKSQMRTLFAKFAIEDLPQNEKRARLAELAMHSGAISRTPGSALAPAIERTRRWRQSIPCGVRASQTIGVACSRGPDHRRIRTVRARVRRRSQEHLST